MSQLKKSHCVCLSFHVMFVHKKRHFLSQFILNLISTFSILISSTPCHKFNLCTYMQDDDDDDDNMYRNWEETTSKKEKKTQSKEKRNFFVRLRFLSGVCLVDEIHLITSGAAAAFIFMYILYLDIALCIFFVAFLYYNFQNVCLDH